MPPKKKSQSLDYKQKKGIPKPPVVRVVVEVVPAAVSVEVALTTSKTKTKTKTTSSEMRAKKAAHRLSSIKQRRIGFLLEEDISKLIDVLKGAIKASKKCPQVSHLGWDPLTCSIFS